MFLCLFLPGLLQNLIRDFEGIHVIASFLSDPAAEVRVHALNALNNLCMNIPNQDQIKVCRQARRSKRSTISELFLSYTGVFVCFIQGYVPHVLELIETSPVNSDLQLGAVRLLTNLSVTDQHQHLLKTSVRLLLSLLVVGNETLQVCFFSNCLKKATFNSSWFLVPVNNSLLLLSVAKPRLRC